MKRLMFMTAMAVAVCASAEENSVIRDLLALGDEVLATTDSSAAASTSQIDKLTKQIQQLKDYLKTATNLTAEQKTALKNKLAELKEKLKAKYEELKSGLVVTQGVQSASQTANTNGYVAKYAAATNNYQQIKQNGKALIDGLKSLFK